MLIAEHPLQLAQQHNAVIELYTPSCVPEAYCIVCVFVPQGKQSTGATKIQHVDLQNSNSSAQTFGPMLSG